MKYRLSLLFAGVFFIISSYAQTPPLQGEWVSMNPPQKTTTTAEGDTDEIPKKLIFDLSTNQVTVFFKNGQKVLKGNASGANTYRLSKDRLVLVVDTNKTYHYIWTLTAPDKLRLSKQVLIKSQQSQSQAQLIQEYHYYYKKIP
jgi:hypothetical protein